MTRRSSLQLFASFIALLLLCSCYGSDGPLSKPGTARDDSILGNWKCFHDPQQDSDETVLIHIFPFDEQQYFAEWIEGEKTTRYRAYPTVLGKSTLLNVTEVSQDATVQDEWVFLRYALDNDQTLHLSIVSDKAVKAKKQDAALQEIRDRVADPTLYESFARCVREKTK